MRALAVAVAVAGWIVLGLPPAASSQVSVPTSEEKPKPTDWPVLRQQRETLLKEIAELERDIADLRSREGRLAAQEMNLRDMESEVARARAQNRLADVQRLESPVRELSDKVKDLKADAEKRKTSEQTLRQKREEINKLDAKIGSLLTPELLFQDFKTSMSKVFAGLVLVVMLGFFLMAWKDETVRRAIFAGTAGIQFVTLFSLVIAIILFGITGILEGKELAALLGGLSGYILGRGTSGGGGGAAGGGGAGGGGGPAVP
jgi:hypothetical protein